MNASRRSRVTLSRIVLRAGLPGGPSPCHWASVGERHDQAKVGVVTRIPQVAGGGREQPIEPQLRVGLRVDDRHSLTAQAWSGQRYQQARGAGATGNQVGQALIDQVSARQSKVGEATRSKTPAHPARRGRLTRYLRAAAGSKVPGTRTATRAPECPVALANILRQFHAGKYTSNVAKCLGGKHDPNR